MRSLLSAAFGALALGLAGPVSAQPWDLFVDPITGEACDLVNATNVELVVFTDTGELVIVSGNDIFLGDSFVDADGHVIFDGLPFGFIGFEEDGDGLPSLWWLTDFGAVVEIDPVTLFPFDSGLFPDEFVNVPCDACPFWDHPLECEDLIFDSDDDGVFDDEDECPDTFPGEIVDDFGCSCEDLGDCDCFFDEDDDGVPDCDDLCLDSNFGADVDDDGCEFDDDNDDDGDGGGGGNVVGCGNVGAAMLGLMVVSLGLLRTGYGRRGYMKGNLR